MKSRPPPLAKLSRPRQRGAVRRAGLYRKLDEMMCRPVVWITGQPGCGKTTLVDSYLEDREASSVWYRADAADADPATFFYFVREAALGLTQRGARAAIPPLLTPEHLVDLPGFARLFFRTFFRRVRVPSFIVIDNYQEIPETSLLHAALAAGLEEAPDGVSVFVLSWTDPPGVYAKLVASSRISRLGWSDLRFSLEEARSLASTLPGVSEALLEDAYERSDGWAAGLRLILEQPASSSESFVSGRGEALFDYFATHIVGSLSVAQRDSLTVTALFSEMTPQMACALSRDPSLADVLADLHRRRLFTERTATSPPRYRYHNLFRQFLFRALSGRLSADALRELRCLAGDVLSEAGALHEALELYIDGREWDRTIDTLLSLAPTLLSHGRWRTLCDAATRIPESFTSARPWLGYWWGLAQMNSDFPGARDRLESSFGSFMESHDRVGASLCVAAILNSYYYEYSNFEPMDPWLKVLDELLDHPEIHWPSASSELFVQSSLLISCVFRQPNHRLLRFAASRVTALLDDEPDVNQRIAAAITLINFHNFALEMPRVRAVLARVLPSVDKPEVTALTRANWHTFVGYHYHRTAEREHSLEEVAKARRVAESAGLSFMVFLARVFECYMHCSWRDTAAAASAIEGLDTQLNDLLPMNGAQYHLAVCCLSLTRGDFMIAAKHARLGLTAVQTVASPALEVLWRMIGASALAANGADEEAGEWLVRTRTICEGSYLECYVPTIEVCEAHRALVAGRVDEARERLRWALSTARERDTFWYFRILCWPLTGRVLTFALAEGIEPAFAGALVDRFRTDPIDPWIEQWPWPVRIRALGMFEIEIRGKPLRFSAKLPRKSLAVVKALIALGGGREVPEHSVADALWAGDEADGSSDALSVAIYRLRKVLGEVGAISVRDGRMRLSPALCWCDAFAFEHFADQVLHGDEPGIPASAERCLSLYGGEFLNGERDASWAVPARERLRAKFVRVVRRYGELLENNGSPGRAIDVYMRGLDADDLVEAFYQGIIRCHLARGERAEGLSVYRRMRQTLSIVLGIAPGEESDALYRALTRP